MITRWMLGCAALVVGTLGVGVALLPQAGGYRVTTSLVFGLVGVAALVVSAMSLRGLRWQPRPLPSALIGGSLVAVLGLYVTITGLISLGLLHFLLGLEIAAAGAITAWWSRAALGRARG